MKIKSIRIKNFKSIIDSGEIFLDSTDGILVLAGQNESGKSSILKAIDVFFNNRKIEEDDIRLNEDGEKLEPEIMISGLLLKSMKSYDAKQFQLGFFERTFNNVIESFAENNILHKLKFDVTRGKIFSYIDDKLIIEFGKQIDRSMNDIDAPNQKKELKQKFGDLICNNIFGALPITSMFVDYCDLLPDIFRFSDLKSKNQQAKGYNAVRNIEAISGVDFLKFENAKNAVKSKMEDKIGKALTGRFNEIWKQRLFVNNGSIDGYSIKIRFNTGTQTFNFYIDSKESEYIKPSQRSSGFRWFLSFFIELKAKHINSEKKALLLIDEPGLYLHVKAQQDILNLFEELKEKHIIIFSTHSPYMLKHENLNRVSLVVNDHDKGTQIKKITDNSLGDNEKDALKPIHDCIGLNISQGFSSLYNGKNVLVEGMSDYHYLSGMYKLLHENNNKEDAVRFIPSVGVLNIKHLLSFCIGWGLNYAIVMDNDKEGEKAKKEIAKFSKEIADEKIYIINKVIEEEFEIDDFRLVKPDTNENKLSNIVKEGGGKVLFSKEFHAKVLKNEITKKCINSETKKRFKKHFTEIDKILN